MTMSKTEYLYGIKPQVLIGMNYVNALNYKINSAKALQDMLRPVLRDNMTDEEKYRPGLERYLASDKAILFNQELLSELEE